MDTEKGELFRGKAILGARERVGGKEVKKEREFVTWKRPRREGIEEKEKCLGLSEIVKKRKRKREKDAINKHQRTNQQNERKKMRKIQQGETREKEDCLELREK